MIRRFVLELDRLKDQLGKMSQLVQRQIDDVSEALFSGDRNLAQNVVDSDGEIDQFEIAIDRTCQEIIALSQPVASDLRLLVSGLKMSTDLERMGDQAANIAREIITAEPLPQSVLEELQLDTMANRVREMVSDAFASFIQSNASQAKSVCDRDDAVDEINLSVIRILSEDNGLRLEYPQRVHLLIITQNIERIGDLATNIAEEVIFLVHARTIKHHYQEFTD